EAEAFRFDVWIDAKYKLIHKVRFADNNNSDDYIDIGQTYTGGDELKLFVIFKGKDYSYDVNLTSNFETQKTTLSVKGEGTDETPYDLEVVTTIEPYSEEINTSEPEGSVDIEKLLQDIQAATGQALGVNTSPKVYRP